MKNSGLLFIGILFIIYSCSNKNKLQKNIERFLNENVKIFNDYQPISTKIIDTLRQFQLDEFNARQSKFIGGKADTASKTDENPSKSVYAYRVYTTLQQMGLQNLTYRVFLDSVIKDDNYIKNKYKQMKVFIPNLQSDKVFVDSLKSSLRTLLTPVGFIVKHKYRLKINGNNILYINKFYIDKDSNVLGYALK